MNKKVLKFNRCVCILLTFILLLSFQMSAFATSHEKANVVIGPKSSEADEIRLDNKNYALESLQGIMDGNDFLFALIYVSEYRKGIKDAADNLKSLIAKYNVQDADKILNYVLQDNKVMHLGSYVIDHGSNTLQYTPINGISSYNTGDITTYATVIWNNLYNLVPVEFSQNIVKINMEFGRDIDNMVSIEPADDDANSWILNIDTILSADILKDDLYKNLIYATTYYYVLKKDQMEILSPKRDCYKFMDKTYKENSYINLFYKKFWKGRRQEISENQYKMYKKEFFNSKASRTVYDDMAVSFCNYVYEGFMTRYLGFRADKNNFFDQYEEFRKMAQEMRIKLGINVTY